MATSGPRGRGMAGNASGWFRRAASGVLWGAGWWGLVALAASAMAVGAAGFQVPRPWGSGQGVDLSMASAMAQTRDGSLWVGTPSGLYRFNGVEFVDVQPPGLATNAVALHVTALHADRLGGLWIGSLAQGVAHYRQGDFRFFRSPDGIGNDRIKAVMEDREGQVWVATDGGGTYRFTGERFEALTLDDGVPPTHPTALAQGPEGRLWLGTHNSGVHRIHGRQVEATLGPNATTKAMVWTAKGELWVATSSGLGRLEGERLVSVPLPGPDGEMTSRVFVTSLAVDGEGALWIGTLTGLIRWQGEEMERFGREEGLGNGLVTAVFADREGSVWVGVEIGDLYQFRRRQVRRLEPFPGRLQAVHSLVEDGEGRLWVGGSEGLVAFQGGRRVWTPSPGDLAANPIAAVGEDAEGRVWFATRFAEWGWWDQGEIRTVSLGGDPRGRTRIHLLHRSDRTGTLWAGTTVGLHELRRDGSLVLRADAELPHRQVVSLCEDRGGALWIGTGHGLSRHAGGRFENFVNLEPRAIEVVSALHADADGGVWIGTDGGLWRYRAGRFFAFGPEHGVPLTVGQILEDNSGHLWVAWGEGVSRFVRSELDAVAEGRASRVGAFSLGRDSGITSVLIGDGGRAVRLRQGHLAFASDNGVVLVDPEEPPVRGLPPPVTLERVVLNGEVVPAATPGSPAGRVPMVRLPPGYNRLEIHYAGLSYQAPETVRFRHRLRGLSDTWEDAGGSRMAQFRTLPPGRYDFEVAARLPAGGWSPEPAVLAIRVLAPWWLSPWFLGGAGVGVVGAAGGWYRLRLRRLERQAAVRRDFSMRLLEREETERRRLSRELHDGLGQDLLLLKNHVNLLEQRLPPAEEELRRRAAAIAEAAQAAIEGARTIARNLRPADLDRAGLTRSLVAMLDRANASSPLVIDHAIETVDGCLTPPAEVVLYRVVQELVNNTLKHARAAHAYVDVRRVAGGLEVVVSDDGCGFDPGAAPPPLGRGRGLGLDSVAERVAMLGGELRMESAPGQGSRFQVRLPVSPGLPDAATPGSA